MFEQFRHRSHKLERLDTGDYTAAEYKRWQKEMRLIHRVFGEMRALRNSVLRDIRAAGTGDVSVLDVGAGSGELLRELATWLVDRKRLLVGVEINHDAAMSIRGDGVSAACADGLQLPFANDSFDHVFCTLTLHHLSDERASRLLQEMARVSRGRIYAIDLNRSPVAYYFYKIVGRLVLQDFTLEDGSLSILRSFAPDELRELARDACLKDIRVEHSRANRLVLSGHK